MHDTARFAALAPQLMLLRRPAAAAQRPSAPNADDTIRAAVFRALARLPRWERDFSNVVVHDGVVMLQGLVADARERRLGVQAAQSVPGVVAVDDYRVLAREG
jgi:osmotically-inducible protein OsmY